MLRAPRQRSSLDGNHSPMSPRAAAPSSASITACMRGVAVGVASQPARVWDAQAAQPQRDAVGEGVDVDAVADAKAHVGSAVRAESSVALRRTQ